MIKSFKHKGLEKFFITGSTKEKNNIMEMYNPSHPGALLLARIYETFEFNHNCFCIEAWNEQKMPV